MNNKNSSRKNKKREEKQLIIESKMDNLKGGRCQCRDRGGREHFRSISFKNNKNNTNSTRNHQRDIIFSPQLQDKKLTSYTTVRDAFIHYIQTSYIKGGQDVTKSLKDINTVDINDE